MKWTMKSLGKKWRDYKLDLKGEYFDGKDFAEVFRNPPDGIIRYQWEFLVSFWNSPEGKNRSERNKKNRSAQKSTHTSGTMSFARKRDKMAENRPDQSEPTDGEVFIETHLKSNGDPMNDAAGDKITQLKTLAAQRSDTLGGYTYVHEDFIAVMGEDRPGHARTHGLGVNPSDLDCNGKSKTSDSTTDSAHDDELPMMKEKVKQMEQKSVETDAKLAFLMTLLPAHLQLDPRLVPESSTARNS